MIKKSLLTFCVCTILACGACNRSTTDPGQADSLVPAVALRALPVSVDSSPEVVTAAFLDALRAGDNAIAEQLLTALARDEAAAHDLSVQPPGSPAATYEIGESRRRGGDARVTSRWTEIAHDGQPITYDIAWTLKRQSTGWRVAGMSTVLTRNGGEVHLNFEDGADLLAKWQRADEELAAEMQAPAALQAKQPRQRYTR